MPRNVPGSRTGRRRHPGRTKEHHTAALVAAEPDRFGFFATAPMPHVEESVAEVIRALDDLNVDGVVLLANNSGTYLGQDGQDDLWAALDARSAVVFIHPAQRPGSSEPTGVRARRRGPHRHAGRRQVDQHRDMTATGDPNRRQTRRQTRRHTALRHRRAIRSRSGDVVGRSSKSVASGA
ncbi:MAG TPA: amidohydrolase family protein [Mycolicibacillus parakoreensis]|uniref:Amidohydrolase family protein n=1 Tax=Mycolicibacillus parakoreensis TaxID=1069221 RepID=A0ABY5T6C1_9MYCO|nr:amidohydrolase family protein [Mycolicibacillus parakoreensis]UVI51718.1 amidohydrolase family protein [Mycolicibacillus parakoreensis]HLR99970.1 amidohydrolase family protein [Mycolicibacillus parakoreensis]